MGQVLENFVEKEWFSPQEYFALEEQAEYKSEYRAGEIVAMSGGSLNHNIIAVNFVSILNQKLKGKTCRPFNSDMKLEIPVYRHYVYPDAMVVCGKVELSANRNDMLTNPTLIAEVLSPSTANYDRNEKFRHYLSLPTLCEYVLISQSEARVETYFKNNPQQWTFTVVEGLDKTLQLASLDLEISMADIFEGVDFGNQSIQNENEK